MNKKRLGLLGAALALGALTGGAQATQNLSQATQQQHSTSSEFKATVERKRKKGAININATGGLDFNPYLIMSAGSPIWYGKSQKSKRTNKLRCSHNAKLKRRKG